jgi:hypothetical protein
MAYIILKSKQQLMRAYYWMMDHRSERIEEGIRNIKCDIGTEVASRGLGIMAFFLTKQS